MGRGLIWQGQANPGDFAIILTSGDGETPFLRLTMRRSRTACLNRYGRQLSTCPAINKKARHREPTAHIRARYRCFLPDLAGLAGVRRVGPIPDPQ